MRSRTRAFSGLPTGCGTRSASSSSRTATARSAEKRSGAAGDLPRFHGDRRKLQQILLNLISNGIKFTKPGGRVTLETEADPETGYLFRISDTGIGIAADDLATALTPFGQVESDLARRYEGTGLGLPPREQATG